MKSLDDVREDTSDPWPEIWGARMIDVDGRVEATWRVGRGLPLKLHYDAKKSITVDRIELIDGHEQVLFIWKCQGADGLPLRLVNGDFYNLKLEGGSLA